MCNRIQIISVDENNRDVQGDPVVPPWTIWANQFATRHRTYHIVHERSHRCTPQLVLTSAAMSFTLNVVVNVCSVGQELTRVSTTIKGGLSHNSFSLDCANGINHTTRSSMALNEDALESSTWASIKTIGQGTRCQHQDGAS